jgi:predicted metal-dependent hydrolase
VTDRVPAALREFVELFDRGEFWASHEVLEGPWREGRSDFLQGLILLASAWVHVWRGNPRGIVAQLRKAELRLSPYRPAHLGVDVESLLLHIERTRAVVARNPGAPPAAWPELAPPPELRLSPALLRGDEPELEHG